MNNSTAFLMEYLTLLKGKSADHITRFLKKCGGGEDGTMIDGLINIVEMLNADKIANVKNARIGGIAIGAIVMVIIGGGINLCIKHMEKKQCCEKIQEVAEISKQEVSLANEEKLPEDENNIIADDEATSNTPTEAPELFPSVE